MSQQLHPQIQRQPPGCKTCPLCVWYVEFQDFWVKEKQEQDRQREHRRIAAAAAANAAAAADVVVNAGDIHNPAIHNALHNNDDNDDNDGDDAGALLARQRRPSEPIEPALIVSVRYDCYGGESNKNSSCLRDDNNSKKAEDRVPVVPNRWQLHNVEILPVGLNPQKAGLVTACFVDALVRTAKRLASLSTTTTSASNMQVKVSLRLDQLLFDRNADDNLDHETAAAAAAAVDAAEEALLCRRAILNELHHLTPYMTRLELRSLHCIPMSDILTLIRGTADPHGHISSNTSGNSSVVGLGNRLQLQQQQTMPHSRNSVLQKLSIRYRDHHEEDEDDNHHHHQQQFDWTAVAIGLEHHATLQKFVLLQQPQGNDANDSEFAAGAAADSHNPTLDLLGEALLRVPNLRLLQIGVLPGTSMDKEQQQQQQDAPTQQQQQQPCQTVMPFSSEVLAALVQHAALKELRLWNCILHPEHVAALATGLRETADTSLWEGGAASDFQQQQQQHTHNHHKQYHHKDDSVRQQEQHVQACRKIAAVAELSEQDFFAVGTLANTGLVHLDFRYTALSHDSVQHLANALSHHPTLKTLQLEHTFAERHASRSHGTVVTGTASLAADWERIHFYKVQRTVAIEQLLQTNTVLEQVLFTLSERDEETVQLVQFFLQLNQRGVRRMKSRVTRSVWGQAVLAMRHEPALLFCLLQQRPDLISTTTNTNTTTATIAGTDNNSTITASYLPAIKPATATAKWIFSLRVLPTWKREHGNNNDNKNKNRHDGRHKNKIHNTTSESSDNAKDASLQRNGRQLERVGQGRWKTLVFGCFSLTPRQTKSETTHDNHPGQP